MFFQYALFSLILIFTSSYVNGHGHLVESFTGYFDFRVNQGGVNECGLVTLDAIRQAMSLSPPVSVILGRPTRFQYQITNQDGAGALTVAFDESGVGNAFTKKGVILDQPPGNNGNLANAQPQIHPITIVIPYNLKCNGPQEICIMQVKQPQGFGSCVFIKVVEEPPLFRNPIGMRRR